MADEKKEVQVAQPSKLVADFDNGIYGSSDSFKLATQMAKGMAASTIVPQTFQKNEANCLVAISQSQKLGIDPLTVMNNMYLIQGRISWKSEFIIAMINNSGKFDFELQYEEEEKDGKPFSCKCWTEKDGRRVEGIKVDMNMAEAEGWTKKNGTKWKTLPQLMLRYRAATFFARFNAPELTSGLYTKEEYEDNDFDSIGKKKASLNDLLQDEEVVEVESKVIE